MSALVLFVPITSRHFGIVRSNTKAPLVLGQGFATWIVNVTGRRWGTCSTAVFSRGTQPTATDGAALARTELRFQ